MVGGLAVRSDVQAFALFVLGHTQADHHVDDLEDDERDDCRPGDRHEHGLDRKSVV